MKRRRIKIKEREFSGPSSWSEQAIYICGSKYARIVGGRWEETVEQIALRIASGIFPRMTERVKFDQLVAILLNQEAAFNSPVWFNLGIEENPQCSACFILKVEDSLESIIEWWRTQARIFDNGSGMGADLSRIREKGALIRNGLGVSSGPQSWAKVSDAIGASVKSGGITRRAATLLSLADWHPDIEEFIKTKAFTEEIINALGERGYDVCSQNSSAYDSIYHQQANRSVRLSEDFMKAAQISYWESRWNLISPLTDTYVNTVNACQILYDIADSIWKCGDPGIMFSDTINMFHTIPSAGSINSSNPCGEYLSIDNSSCNLASINLLKFYNQETKQFHLVHLREVVNLLIEAQDKLIDISSYPTYEIQENSRKYRQLGLGITNLGGLLMLMGLPYASEDARVISHTLMSLITSWGWIKSAATAITQESPYTENPLNAEATYAIISDLSDQLFGIAPLFQEEDPLHYALMMAAIDLQHIVDTKSPLKNSQISAIAPTGTISLIMDCASTGCEPVYSLSYTKELAQDGRVLKISLPILDEVLSNLGYSNEEIRKIDSLIKRGKDFKPLLKSEHIPILATALEIEPLDHLRMVGVLQQAVSGGISKTINLPKETTKEEIQDYIIEAWKLGIKGITFYRTGSKAAQPILIPQEEKIDEFVCWQCHVPMIQTGTCWICPSCGEGGICG